MGDPDEVDVLGEVDALLRSDLRRRVDEIVPAEHRDHRRHADAAAHEDERAVAARVDDDAAIRPVDAHLLRVRLRLGLRVRGRVRVTLTLASPNPVPNPNPNRNPNPNPHGPSMRTFGVVPSWKASTSFLVWSPGQG